MRGLPVQFTASLLGLIGVQLCGCVDFGENQTPPPLESHVDDWRDEVIYQVLVDRFANGDPSNDFGVRFDDLARYQGGDWKGLEDHLDYLQELGVTVLWISPVIRNVETDANVDGYHGYWAQDFSQLNPHFGDIVALRSLVRASHDRDIKIIVDIVTNHVGQAFYYDMNLNGVPDINFQGNGGHTPTRHFTEYDPDFDPRGIQAFTSLGEAGPAPAIFQWDPETNHLPPQPDPLQDPASYNRKGRTYDFDDPDQLLHGDFPGGLKDLDTTRCDIKQMFVDVMVDLVSQTDIDGFRIDTVKHVEYEFWRYFTQSVRHRLARLGKTNFLLFGEVFDGRDDLIGSYTRHEILNTHDLAEILDRPLPTADATSDQQQLAGEAECVLDAQPLTGDQLDSVFYFSQHFTAIREVLTDAQSTDRIRQLWSDRLTNWGDTPNIDGIGVAPRDMPVNFLDNHDVGRFLFNVRDLQRDQQRALLHNALVFLFTSQGVPCLYYGTEQEFSGGNDPANRERLWDSGYSTTGPTFEWIRRLNRIRRDYASLRRGDTHVLWATPHTGNETDAGIFAFERWGADSGGSYSLVILNSHHGQASRPQFENSKIMVSAPAGTELVDVLNDDESRLSVTDDRTIDISVAPMQAFIFVPASELRPTP